MEGYENYTLIKTEYDSCYRRGNVEINYYEDKNGNEVIHIVDQNGGEWFE